ncbi:hypothetical protein L226DRAFT_527192 [Lentinus tigrinus ALCF2SS1-7]|uniref:uncharacterized protein n=1 Tax=Lentinus tigrinus ALCF2SS1-7 TaxID=1328758 RepID=UPI0011660B8C|nr:hypothetical protein L226DRAFT_527192 [Lentinus tigrinus ALCF2SS1-7]
MAGHLTDNSSAHPGLPLARPSQCIVAPCDYVDQCLLHRFGSHIYDFSGTVHVRNAVTMLACSVFIRSTFSRYRHPFPAARRLRARRPVTSLGCALSHDIWTPLAVKARPPARLQSRNPERIRQTKVGASSDYPCTQKELQECLHTGGGWVPGDSVNHDQSEGPARMRAADVDHTEPPWQACLLNSRAEIRQHGKLTKEQQNTHRRRPHKLGP